MNLKALLFSFLTLVSLSIFTACGEDEEVTTPAKKTIVDVVIADANFSLLKTAVVHAGLDKTLSETNNLTVFAPTNDAFKAIGLSDDAAILKMDKVALGNILKFHVLTTKVPSTDIKTADNQELTMFNAGKAYLTKDANGVSINGAKVEKADVPADNGVIHVINAVIMPPSTNIVDAVVGNPDLSLLKEAVLRANEGTTKVVTVLSGAGPFTVFAPTNKAFLNAGFDSAKIKDTDPNSLATILTYHVIAARVHSTNLKNGNVKTVEGREVTIDAANATVRGGLNSSPSKVEKANIIATNGVIHVIDNVLLPK
jgi:uncharacterized surface protein with fasciclin (FAS1) repeats